MIKGIIFDADGTLFDTTGIVISAFQKAAESKGRQIGKEEISRLLGIPRDEIIGMLFSGDSRDFKLEIRRLWIDFGREMIGRDAARLLFPETLSALTELDRRGIRMAVASGLDRPSLDFLLEKSGIGNIIKASVSGEETGRGKPHPDIIIEALKRIGTDHEESLAVGDMEWDIIAGKAAGCRTVLIQRSRGREIDADEKIRSLSELTGLV